MLDFQQMLPARFTIGYIKASVPSFFLEKD